MHDVLRQRLIRKIESLPEEQIYQVLDYIEFLDAKYGAIPAEPSGLQKLAEGLEDKMRKKAMNPATLREAFQVISTADKVLSSVSNAGRRLMDELTGTVDPDEEAPEGSEPPGEGEGGEDTAPTGGSSRPSEGGVA